MEKLWFNYIIYNNINKTYIGSTNNIDRRIRQHNGFIKGGAKYTTNNLNKLVNKTWFYYSIIYTFNFNKQLYLSREWYIKYFRKKYKLYGFHSKELIETLFSKKNKINKHNIKYKKYKHIIFINKKYKNYIPILSSKYIIIILDNMSSEIIYSFIKTAHNYLFL